LATLDIGSHINARLELLLEAVSSRPLIMIEASLAAYPGGMLVVEKTG
jgi:hypothetical protein